MVSPYKQGVIAIELSQTKDVKATMRELELKSGVNCQKALKQKGVKQTGIKQGLGIF